MDTGKEKLSSDCRHTVHSHCWEYALPEPTALRAETDDRKGKAVQWLPPHSPWPTQRACTVGAYYPMAINRLQEGTAAQWPPPHGP
jgi:hypothetical protein